MKTTEKKEISKLSPFELKSLIIDKADKKIKNNADTLLNAGRGNPNWVATRSRDAFFALGMFAMEECRRTGSLEEGIAGVPDSDGIAARFAQWLKDNATLAGTELLAEAYSYCLFSLAADPDELVAEWVNGIVGDDYPSPDRILKYTQEIGRRYLDWALCGSTPDEGRSLDLFAVEGSTAGMVYCFNVLKQNFLLQEGDNVALMVPIFTPYIEIPQLKEFNYTVLNLRADTRNAEGLHT